MSRRRLRLVTKNGRQCSDNQFVIIICAVLIALIAVAMVLMLGVLLVLAQAQAQIGVV